MTEEDKRTAVGISVTLSSQLITAALAMLAIEGAFVAFALGNRNVIGGFLCLSVLTAILFILSIFIAGKGITKARNEGFKGTWKLEAGENHFNWQAILCILGLASFMATLLLSGGPRESEIEARIEKFGKQISTVESQIQTISKEASSIKKSGDDLSSKIDQIQLQFNRHVNDKKLHPTK
jgi:hypothetical protein